MAARSFAVVLFAACLSLVGAGWCDESPEYKVEWEDDFEGQKLNTSKWSIVCNNPSASGCDSVPYPTHAASNGGECRSATCIPEAVTVGGGYLTLTSARVNGTSNWTTGAVKTWGKAAWTTDDGTFRMCISAKLPGGGGQGKGQGIWPAHWMMPFDSSCDPDEGEMDILEMVSGTGTVYSTYHWQTDFPNTTCAFPKNHEHVWGEEVLGEDWADEFHEFGVERSSDHIMFSVDGSVIVNASVQSDKLMLWPKPFYLILNTAVGGHWPGEPDNRTVSPTNHVIDYVRLARKKMD